MQNKNKQSSTTHQKLCKTTEQQMNLTKQNKYTRAHTSTTLSIFWIHFSWECMRSNEQTALIDQLTERFKWNRTTIHTKPKRVVWRKRLTNESSYNKKKDFEILCVWRQYWLFDGITTTISRGQLHIQIICPYTQRHNRLSTVFVECCCLVTV